MTYLMINDEQARAIAQSSAPVVFVDRRGQEVGRFKPLTDEEKKSVPPLSPEELAELKRRMELPGPGKSTAELLDNLRALAPVQGG